MADKIPRTELRRNGRVVEVEEDDKGVVRLLIDGHPVEVEVIDGQYYSHLAGMFESFGTVFELIDRLFTTEGTTWAFQHAHHPHPHAAGGHDGGHQR